MRNKNMKSLALRKKIISNINPVGLKGGRALPTTQQSTVVFTGCVCDKS
jgi:hypothetical protein